MTRMPKQWWRKKLPKGAQDKTQFSTKTDALRVFIERNRGVIDNYGGESAVHRPAEFDAINHRFELTGARQVQTIAGALWYALRGGPPWRLQDIDVELLNDTTPGQYVGGFQLPDQVHEQIQQHQSMLHYEDQGIGEGLIDQCFDRFRVTRHGRFRKRTARRGVRGVKRERACVCRTPHGRFEKCATRTQSRTSGAAERTPKPNTSRRARRAAQTASSDAYEAKQDARRERYEQLATKASRRARGASVASRGAVAGIPMGQPILAGHHSERKHRAALRRSDRAMRKSIEESNKAAHFAGKAAGVGKGGISSDDPAAIDKLRAKLAELEKKREAIKRHNRDAKKNNEEKAPPYMLANLGANIRRYRERIKLLEAQRTEPERAAVEGDGFRFWEDREQNRLLFRPERRLDKEQRDKFRRAGFVFSRANNAFQRKISNQARYRAEQLAQELFGWVDGVPF